MRYHVKRLNTDPTKDKIVSRTPFLWHARLKYNIFVDEYSFLTGKRYGIYDNKTERFI